MLWPGFLKRRHRDRMRLRVFPSEWRAAIEQSVSFFPRLSPNDRDELLGHVQVFLAESGSKAVPVLLLRTKFASSSRPRLVFCYSIARRIISRGF